ncbi:MAG: hypothetical protein F9K19_02575 [Rhizobiaceae bacterium]|jgi:hypothetical protein|nr:MAG: hypothetical protein F9K19_02575 [Rhizobiaceae bacterium]
MTPVLPDGETRITIDEPVNAPELEALQSLIDIFVVTTLETISATDTTSLEMFDDPAYRTRVDEILARLGEVEALTAIVRKLNEA